MAEGGVKTAEEATETPHLWINVCDSMMANIGEGEQVHYSILSGSTDPLFRRLTYRARRSYSDFANLRQLLISRHGELLPPVPAYNFGIESKRWLKMLQDYIYGILDIQELRSDPCLELFLQSLDSMAVIRAKVEAMRQPQDLLDQNREPQDQAAAKGDDNDDQEIPMHRLSIAPVLRDEIPKSRDQEAPLRRPRPDRSAMALPDAIPCSMHQQIPMHQPEPDESAMALQDKSPGSSGSSEELIFSMDDVD